MKFKRSSALGTKQHIYIERTIYNGKQNFVTAKSKCGAYQSFRINNKLIQYSDINNEYIDIDNRCSSCELIHNNI